MKYIIHKEQIVLTVVNRVLMIAAQDAQRLVTVNVNLHVVVAVVVHVLDSK